MLLNLLVVCHIAESLHELKLLNPANNQELGVSDAPESNQEGNVNYLTELLEKLKVCVEYIVVSIDGLVVR